MKAYIRSSSAWDRFLNPWVSAMANKLCTSVGSICFRRFKSSGPDLDNDELHPMGLPNAASTCAVKCCKKRVGFRVLGSTINACTIVPQTYNYIPRFLQNNPCNYKKLYKKQRSGLASTIAKTHYKRWWKKHRSRLANTAGASCCRAAAFRVIRCTRKQTHTKTITQVKQFSTTKEKKNGNSEDQEQELPQSLQPKPCLAVCLFWANARDNRIALRKDEVEGRKRAYSWWCRCCCFCGGDFAPLLRHSAAFPPLSPSATPWPLCKLTRVFLAFWKKQKKRHQE